MLSHVVFFLLQNIIAVATYLAKEKIHQPMETTVAHLTFQVSI
jgi:hypothetical protein